MGAVTVYEKAAVCFRLESVTTAKHGGQHGVGFLGEGEDRGGELVTAYVQLDSPFLDLVQLRHFLQ